MSVYRRKFKAKDGTARKSRFYTVEFKASDGTLHRASTKFTDKKAAQAREAELRVGIERGAVGLVDPFKEHRGAAVVPLIERYVGYLTSTLNRDSMYGYIADKRLRKVAGEAAWLVLADVTVASYERWREAAAKTKYRGKLLTPKTLNQYIDTLRGFGDWCVNVAHVLPANPFAAVAKANVIDNKHYRRAGTEEELAKLLDAVTPDRRRFYTFVLYHPLRRRTLKALRWHNLHLKDARPWGETPAEHTKSRRVEKFAIRKSVAEMLLNAKHDQEFDAPVFPYVPTAEDLREDLKLAGVTFANKDGSRRLDLHAFRRTMVKLMKAQGVPLEEASRALHHKTLATTKKYYEDEADEGMTDAVERMPDVGGGK